MVAVLLLAGCSAAPASSPSPPIPTDPLPTAAAAPITISELKADLIAAGASLEDGDRLENQLATSGRELLVSGQSVRVYQVPSDANGDLMAASMASAPADGRAPAIWTSSGLVVAYDGEDGGTRLLLSGLLGDPLQPNVAVQDEPYPPAVLAAIERAANESGVSPNEVAVVSFSPMTWENACLGLPAADENCEAGLIDGWRVVLRAGTNSYELHTDAFGERIRVQ